MGIVSVSVPDELRQKMNALDQINWSAVARKAFEEKMKEMALLKKIQQSEKQIREGKVLKVNTSMTDEEIDDLLMS